jgi:hypothetical protein
MDVFDMQMLHHDKQEGGAIYLTDGYFNLAILPNHEQNSPNGLYHFGFEVENGEAIVEKMKKSTTLNCRSNAPTAGPMRRLVAPIRMVIISTFPNMDFSGWSRWARKSRVETITARPRRDHGDAPFPRAAWAHYFSITRAFAWRVGGTDPF